MQLSRGLYLNLYGVMRGNKALNLPKGSHSSVRVKKEKNGKISALVKFLEKEDGNWDPPLEELNENDMSYFLVQVVNTFSGAQFLVRVNGKEKEVKTNKKGINYCFVRRSAQILRYDRKRRYLEIYDLYQFTVENKKRIVSRTIFEGWIENTKELVKEFPILAQFKNEIEKLVVDIPLHKQPLTQKLDLKDLTKKTSQKVLEESSHPSTQKTPFKLGEPVIKEVELKKTRKKKNLKQPKQSNRKKVVLKKVKEEEAKQEIREVLQTLH